MIEAVVANRTQATIDRVHRALVAREPIALLDPNHPAAELDRQRRCLADAASNPFDDAAFVLFTSGSTSQPRGVVLSRRAIEAAADASAAHIGWRDDDRWLLALSLAHTGGLAVVVRCWLADKQLVVVDSDGRDGRRALVDAVARSTLASLVPTQLAMLLDDPAWRSPVGLRAALLGGAGAPPSLLDAAAARGVPFLTTYGMTESFGQVATAPLARAGDPRALPVPLPGVTIDATPRIRVSGPMLATCYLDGTPIAPMFETADLGELGPSGLRVIGRVDDVIVTGGENVQPADIEAVLAATPGVRAACAFAVPDARWGAIVGAAISVDPPRALTASDPTRATTVAADPVRFDLAIATARWHDALPPRARPRRLAIVAELPRLPSGKLDRRAAALLASIPIDYARSEDRW